MNQNNELIIRKKLREVRAKASNMGRGKKDYTLKGVTIAQLLDQIEDLLDDEPKTVHVYGGD